MLREWEEEWVNSKQANHAKSFYRGPNPTKARFVYKLARLELGRFVRVITGHNNLNFFQEKLGLTGSSLCRFCENGDETITHLLSVCPRFVNSQRELFMGRLPLPDMTWSVRTLLNFSYIPGINEAFEGTWASWDALPGHGNVLDDSLGLGDWLDAAADMDEYNNNTQASNS